VLVLAHPGWTVGDMTTTANSASPDKTSSRPWLRHVLAPLAAIGTVLLIGLPPWDADNLPPIGWIFLFLPGIYLVMALIRRQRIGLQLIGLALFGPVAIIGAYWQSDVAIWLGGTAWLLHGVWDVVHYRANQVVPRWYSEWCTIVDIIMGILILGYAISRLGG
jgi:uncharacterized membrane protein HdeD (DUF308 family)